MSQFLIVCFDVETNGFQGLNLFSKLHRVIEFGARWGNKPDEFYSSLVHPLNLILHPQSNVHGIDSKMLENAPQFHQIWTEFKQKSNFDKYEFIYMVAHNCMHFDKIMLEKEHIPQSDYNKIKWVDTLHIAKKLWANQQNLFNLGSLHAFLTDGTSVVDGALHRVEFDCDILWEITSVYIVGTYGVSILERYSNVDSERIKYIGPYYSKKLRNFGLNTKEDVANYVQGDPTRLDNFLFYKIGIKNESWRQVIVYQILRCHAGWMEFPYDCVDQYLIEWDSPDPIRTTKAIRGRSYIQK